VNQLQTILKNEMILCHIIMVLQFFVTSTDLSMWRLEVHWNV